MKSSLESHPLTQSQLALYYESINNPGLPFYVIPVMFSLDPSVDTERLRSDVDRVISLHPLLSMTLQCGDDGMPSLVESPRLLTCSVEELSASGFQALRSNLPSPFILDGGHLFEARIFKTPEASYLYIAIHHIIGDGTTFNNLVHAIADAYAGKPLTPPSLTIFDVQAREEANRLSPRFEEARTWHADTFSGIETDSMPLPDKLEETAEGNENILSTLRRRVKQLSADYDKVFALSRTLRVPLSIVLDGAFGYLAGIWSASDESTFSTIFAGRKDDADREVAGMMVKTVPLYCSWQPETTVAEYLHTLAEQHAKAKDYADTYSFADVCADTGISPRLNFSYRGSIQMENAVIPGFCTGSARLGYYTTGDSLLFMVDHVNGGLSIRAEYSTADYSEQYIDSLIDAYDMVLRGFITCERLADITLCSPEMTSRLDRFNATFPTDVAPRDIADAFLTHAAERPDALLMVNDDAGVTYAEGARTASAIAAHLRQRGIGPDSVVAVMVDRNEYMVTASLGVLLSGAAYEPLDISYPAQRLNYMMRDAGATLLIRDRDIDFRLEEDLQERVDVIYTDEIPSLPVSGNLQIPEARPESPFIVLYTSGTTGLPKGVVLTRGNLASFCAMCSRGDLAMEPGDAFAMYASYGFDAGFFSILYPVWAGGTVAVVPEEIRLDIDALNDFLVRHNVSHAFMTTQVGRIFATTIEETSLRVLAVGGEKLVPCAPPKGYTLLNIYGPTEGTVFSHSQVVDRLYRRVPIGMHNDDYKNYITDKHGRLLPLGALGELVIAGPQVGVGYLNLPDKTAAAFGLNPFSDDPAYARLYHTGDVVRLLPTDGAADIIGRRDGQVKIRGFRIELSEVERVVREFPSVKDATVQAFDNPAGGKFIAAYVVSDQPIDTRALADFIAETKPPYMVPEVIMQIDAIPLNRNQKVDKRALPEPTLQASADSCADTRKPNLLEQRICAVVADVLKHEETPLSLPLSMLGLTSISSIRLASALFKNFGVAFKGADLVKDATVLTIEDAILEHLLDSPGERGEQRTDKNNGEGSTPSGTGPQQRSADSAPLTVSQQGVYADAMRSPGTTAYNIPVYFRFAPDTDTQALADALVRILDAHPYLRDVHLAMGDLDVEQTVSPQNKACVAVAEMSDSEFDEYLRHFIRPFDLMEAPLFRLEVVKTPQGVFLLMDVQHIAFDGSSLTILLQQLKTLLEGGGIAAEEYTYLDYAVEEQRMHSGEEGARAAAFFKEMLADCEAASDIPSDQPSDSEPGERGIVARPIDMERTEAFCRKGGLTPAALFLAATCYATARFTSSRSAFISTISSGRSDVRFADTFGMFVKTLPIGLAIGDETAIAYALKAGDTLSRAVENEIYPYARICADYNYAPNIVYEYQYGLVDDLLIGGRAVERRLFDVDTLKFRIAVRIEEVEGRPSVAVHYRRGIYSDELMTTFCESIAMAAGRIMADPQAPVRRLSLVTDEQRALLEGFATTEVSPHSPLCLHELMEEQARLHPERRAVVATDRTLTYAELDRLANVVANNLIAKGVKRGDKVVLLLSRTSRFFTSLYGVLKAGAAYIPSSPDYPEERKQSIISDSEATWVITDDNVEELHRGDNCAKPDVEVTPDDLVYLIYTSGSTGKPKGVLLRHRGIVNYVTPAPSVVHTQAIVERATVVGSITTVAFDMALKEWGIALSNGLTLVFANDEQSNDPVALARLFSEQGVDYFNTTPSRMQQYMDLDEFCAMLGNCKVVICGAEKYPEYLVQRLRDAAPEAEIFNTYGPTEITVSCNACNLTRRPSVSVGRPLRNYIEHIVDADDNLLPPGVIGELLIGGDNIARGYNANPEQTAKAFIEFMGLPTYRSGDYARWDAEGNVVILGRKDTQVKLRGLRIELGEIERVIGDIDGIAVSHIMIRNVAGRENLVAYYALKQGASLSADDIKSRMAEKLTDYMVPSFFVEMEQMPLTPNGKINTRALPEPAVAEREAGRAAANDMEKFFIDIYKTILGTDTVYADDSFFALGGTSLTATRIMIAASKAGHHIVYADIFANPTPEGLARLLGGGEASPAQQAPCAAASATPAKGVPEPADGYDYTAIDRMLASNTLESFRSGTRRSLGTVMLTGATGFAGMHVLRELLTAYDVDVVCLGRDSRSGVDAAERIEQLYFYYFGESLSDKYPGRVKVVKGDITKIDKDFDPGTEIATVINCAANVKHFSAGTDIEDINYYGVLNLIDWCRAHGAVLVQTSTVSVTGRQAADRDEVLTEQSLYIGQDLSGNKYITSKFLAERAVLEAHARGEIVGKVVRLGNLAPRERDGEFQINFHTNGFMNRLKSIVLVGCYPYSMYSQNKDISPIDDVARAIVLFAQTPDACTVFHGNNANRYSLGNFYYEASLTGLDIHPVETDVFAAALEEAKADPEKLPALVGLMAYEGMGAGLKPVDYSNDYSSQVLLRMGFHWPVVSSSYVEKLVRQLEGLGFFSI